MKNLTLLLWAIAVVCLFSCNTNKYDSTVKINEDGSCSREFIVLDPDSAFMNGDTSSNPFPMKIDSSWKISWKNSSSKLDGMFSPWPVKNWVRSRDTSQHLILTVVAHKEYATVEAMARNFRYDHSQWNNIVQQISLKKKFRFFFTFYTYREVYPKYSVLNRIPISNYLTDDEVKMFFLNNPKFDPGLNGAEIKEILDGMDKKKDKWLNQSIFEEVYYILPKHLYLLNKPIIDSSRFLRAKDSVYNLLKDNDDLKSNFALMLNKYFKTKEFTEVDSMKNFIATECDHVEERIIKPFSVEINYNLIMPGVILQTSSKQAHGDTLTWKVEPYRFSFTDYELMAESRVANIWAFVVSALFLIIVTGSFFIKRK